MYCFPQRAKGSTESFDYCGGTIGRRGHPRTTRVEEEIPAPPHVAPELASSDESHHPDSEHEFSDGESTGISSVPSAPTAERVPLAIVIMNSEEFALLIARVTREIQGGRVPTTEGSGDPSVITVQRELAKLPMLIFEGGPRSKKVN